MMSYVLKFMLGHLIVALMVSVGLAARPRDLGDVVRRPSLYLRALLVVELGVPVLAMALVSSLHVPRFAGGLVLLMAICPGAPFIPIATRAKGEPFSVPGLNILVLTSALAPLTIPLWVAILNDSYAFEFRITPLAVLVRVLELVILPLTVGFALRALLPRVAAVASELVHGFFVVALIVTMGVTLYTSSRVIIETKPIVLLAITILIAGAAAMGTLVVPRQPAEQRAIAISAVLGNPGLALTVMGASYPGVQAFALIGAYVLYRKVAFTPFEVLLKRRAATAA